MAARVKILNSTPVYRGKVISVKVDRVIEPGGVEAVREVVCHPGSVVVLAHLPDRRLLLVRQYRYPAGRPLWELVAGGLEPDESPIEAGHRELLEETGYRAGAMTSLLDFFPSPGILSERMHLVEARGLTPSSAQPDADERIQLGRFTLGQLREMLDNKKIIDGKTLVGLYWLLSRPGPKR